MLSDRNQPFELYCKVLLISAFYSIRMLVNKTEVNSFVQSFSQIDVEPFLLINCYVSNYSRAKLDELMRLIHQYMKLSYCKPIENIVYLIFRNTFQMP